MAVVNLQNIGETDQTRGPRRLEPAAERGATNRSSSSTIATDSDAIRVSGRAEQVRNLIINLRALPEIRQERVDDLQVKIQVGSYRPEPYQVAEAILQAA